MDHSLAVSTSRAVDTGPAKVCIVGMTIMPQADIRYLSHIVSSESHRLHSYLNKTRPVRTVSPELLSSLHIEAKFASPHVSVNNKKSSTMVTRN